MVVCDECGKELTLPFKCNYCNSYFCGEHRLPENHSCVFAPKRTPLGYWKAKKKTKKWNTTASTRKTSYAPFNWKKASFVAIGVISITLLTFFVFQQFVLIPQLGEPNNSSDTTNAVVISNETEIDSTSNAIPNNQNSPTQQELIDYALSLINDDRQANGLEKVSLSTTSSAQSHAESMLENSFFSHWSLNGYKPYMRYTLEGGQGAVSENIAHMFSTGYIDPTETIKDLQWEMMYNDADSDWGHRDNILNPFHNKVSIGIAYSYSTLYLVQDFEDDYVSWDTLEVSANEVTMSGTIITESGIEQIAVYYDNPVSLTPQQLENSPYDNGYDTGVYVGVVVPPLQSGWEYQQPNEGILIVADRWGVAGQDFDLYFNLSSAFTQYGKGVYTLYMWLESSNYVTTFSIWYGN